MKPMVSLVECPDYDERRVYVAVKRSLEPLGGMEAFVRPGQTALIQPNLLAPRPPETAVCTHPSVVAAVSRLVGEAGGIPWVGGSSAATGAYRTQATLKTSGIGDAAGRTGALVLDFDHVGGVDLPVSGAVMRSVHIAGPVLEADVVITVPKMKTHALTLLTGAVKNHLGTVPGARKAELHRRFPDRVDFGAALVDLYAAAPPDLAIMDAVEGMDKDGPGTGRRRRVGLIAAGADGVAADAVMCAVCGLEARWVTTLAACRAKGIGEPSVDEVEVLGLPLADARAKVDPFAYPLTYRIGTKRWFPEWGRAAMARYSGAPTPFVRTELCTGCQTCVRSCPLEAMTLSGATAKIDQSACISCFCCQEVCPEQAVGIKGPLMWRLMRSW